MAGLHGQNEGDHQAESQRHRSTPSWDLFCLLKFFVLTMHLCITSLCLQEQDKSVEEMAGIRKNHFPPSFHGILALLLKHSIGCYCC